MQRQVLFGQLRGTRPVGSPLVSLRSLMRKVVLLLNGRWGSGAWSAWTGLHGGLAQIRCFEVFRSLHGLEIHWDGSQGPPLGPCYNNTDRQRANDEEKTKSKTRETKRGKKNTALE